MTWVYFKVGKFMFELPTPNRGAHGIRAPGGGVIMRRILAVVLLAALAGPTVAWAQQWSVEEQELVDYLEGIWDQIEENNEATFEIWHETVNPKEDLVWWFTHRVAPDDLRSVEKWHQGWETRGAEYTYLDVRPIAVRLIDSVGMVWFYAQGEFRGADGEYHQFSGKRLEIFHKTEEGWKFVGGMADPIERMLGDGG
jgi:hypothetical protein